MSVEYMCGDPAALAGYLYDECEPTERAAIEAHLAVCVSCGLELGALGATRTALASWTPPDARLGFRITASPEAEASNVIRPLQFRAERWWQRPMPAWAQAAAAILIFAAGASLGMRSGGQPAAPQVQAQATGSGVTTVSARDLAVLEQKLRSEMQALRTTTAPASAVQVPASPNDAAVLQRVNTLLAESERRQERELALRLTQVMRDVDSQRRMDLSRIERWTEDVTRPELAEQREAIRYLIQRTGVQRAPQE